MQLQSTAFDNGQIIPEEYTCVGQNVSPPLTISAVPPETKSLTLIVDDPDAPRGTWVHWLVWNINPATTQINRAAIPLNAIEGTTSFGTVGYGGPCPPSGTHRYFFKLYALDSTLQLGADADKNAVLREIEGHIIEQAELMGTFSKQA